MTTHERGTASGETRRVEDGQVFCVRRGHRVSVDRCLRCSRLAEFELDTTHPWVLCETPPPEASLRGN